MSFILKSFQVIKLIRPLHSLEKTLIQLNEANAELEKLNIDKDRFLAILGHDLRSPFTTLLGLSDLLIESITEFDIDEIKSMADGINKTAQSTFNLLEDNIDVGKITTRKDSLQTAKSQFYRYLQECT